MRFSSLNDVLIASRYRAEHGKGKVRHVVGDEEFKDQIICDLERQQFGFARGQAAKKLQESLRLKPKEAIEELLGAIVYIAAAIIVLQEKDEDE